jgi:hypothetical protein
VSTRNLWVLLLGVRPLHHMRAMLLLLLLLLLMLQC